MAFVNEELTPKQRDEFEAKEIRNPFNPFWFLRPLYRTVDEESNSCLICCYYYHETADNCRGFLLFYKGYRIKLQALYICKKGVKTRWEIRYMNDFPNDLISEINRIDQLIIDAFETYKIDGSPSEENLKCNVICTVIR